MTYAYALEKVKSAIHALATGSQPIKVRLYVAGIILQKIHPTPDLPANARLFFAEIMEILQKHPATRDQHNNVIDDSIKTTTKKMKNMTASAIAARILELRSLIDDEIRESGQNTTLDK